MGYEPGVEDLGQVGLKLEFVFLVPITLSSTYRIGAEKQCHSEITLFGGKEMKELLRNRKQQLIWARSASRTRNSALLNEFVKVPLIRTRCVGLVISRLLYLLYVYFLSRDPFIENSSCT